MITGNQRMIARQIKGQGITWPPVLQAMRNVDRALFVPAHYMSHAYADGPLPIGYQQTISQPYIVAYMLDQLKPQPGDIALEVGAGSGYAAAILSHLVKTVYALELIQPLCKEATRVLEELGLDNIHMICQNGCSGYAPAAPFDVIMVSCAARRVPQPLIDQLAPGGRMIIPVGRGAFFQYLELYSKTHAGEIQQTRLLPVRFVPLVGEAGPGD